MKENANFLKNKNVIKIIYDNKAYIQKNNPISWKLKLKLKAKISVFTDRSKHIETLNKELDRSLEKQARTSLAKFYGYFYFL